MDEQQQQEQQQPGDAEKANQGPGAPNTTNQRQLTDAEVEQPGAPNTTNQRQLTDAEVEQQKAKAAQEQAAAAGDPTNKTQPHAGLLGRLGHSIEHVTGVEAIQRHEKRRQAFAAAKAGPVGAAINDVNAFINAMEDCDADTPEEMLADTDVQNAAKRAREGLKVFTGDTPVTFSKPTSDAHLNIGSGGAVTGNTPANKDKAAAVKDEHDDDEETAAAGITNVPQPDAHVR
jgi:hypothetical protein